MSSIIPQVSVVIPAYNAAGYLAAALASAQTQSLTELEIIVVDDASTDETQAIVAAAAARDARVRLLRMPRNQGPSAARNAAIASARGTWVALLDADDTYAPGRLELLVSLGERRAAALVSDNLWLVPEADPERARAMIPSALLAAERELGLAEFVQRNAYDPAYPDVNFGFLKPIFRRSFLLQHRIRYDETVRFAEDFALYLECFRNGAVWWLTPEPSYRYTVRKHSLTQVQTVHDLARLRTRQARLLRDARAKGDRELEAYVLRHMRAVDRCYYYRGFTDELKRRDFSSALGYLLDGPEPAALILAESLRQLPTVTRKALRGGYRRAGNHGQSRFG